MQRGDAAAIDQFYSDYYPTFVRVMIRLVGDFATAQDLAHDAILKVIVQADRYVPAPGRTLRAWVMTVLKYTFLDWSRRQKARRTTQLDTRNDGETAANPGGGDAGTTDPNTPAPVPAADTPSPHERAEAEEKINAVQAAMLMLTEEQRLLITLRLYEGMGIPEIGDVLGIPQYATVAGRLHRAKSRLREILEVNWPDLFSEV